MERKTNNIKVTVFNTREWVSDSFDETNKDYGFDLDYQEARLCDKTTMLARGSDVVCAFVNDEITSDVLSDLKELGVKLIALRSTGFNNVDIEKARELELEVVRVPAYSPHAIAEHAAGLILSLNRKFHKAYSRVRDGNFALDGLLGFDLHNKTVGVVGTGKIGKVFFEIMKGFGCNVIGYDKYPNKELSEKGLQYVSMEELYRKSDIISLHCPLTYDTVHLINSEAVDMMKDNVMLINTSRGKLIDTTAVIDGLKSKKIGYLGLDVYEEEENLFFEDLSEAIIQDDQFVRLQTFPNVLITSHQAFFTKEAIANISSTTFANISEYFEKGKAVNSVLTIK